MCRYKPFESFPNLAIFNESLVRPQALPTTPVFIQCRAFEATSCPTWPNEIKKLKLKCNTEPRHWINTLLCTGRFLSTVIKQWVFVASQIFVGQQVYVHCRVKGQTETVRCKQNVVSSHYKFLRVQNSCPTWPNSPRAVNFFLSSIFLNVLCQTLKKIALRAHYICRRSKCCQWVITQIVCVRKLSPPWKICQRRRVVN